MSVVLDASAVLAILFDEIGGDHALRSARGALLSTVNLVEILAKAAGRSIDAQHAMTQVERLGIVTLPFSTDEALLAATLLPATRAYGLSLADRACLALGMSRKMSVLTTDRVWADLNIGIDIQLIR